MFLCQFDGDSMDLKSKDLKAMNEIFDLQQSDIYVFHESEVKESNSYHRFVISNMNCNINGYKERWIMSQ